MLLTAASSSLTHLPRCAVADCICCVPHPASKWAVIQPSSSSGGLAFLVFPAMVNHSSIHPRPFLRFASSPVCGHRKRLANKSAGWLHVHSSSRLVGQGILIPCRLRAHSSALYGRRGNKCHFPGQHSCLLLVASHCTLQVMVFATKHWLRCHI